MNYFNLMRHFNLEFDYGNGINYFTIFGLSDIHAGNQIDEALLDKAINEIEKTENSMWFGGGDLIDAIVHKDRRFEIESIADWVSLKDPIGSQIDFVTKKLSRIAHKCLGLVEGNHEYTASRDWVRDVHQSICSNLNVRSFGSAATVNLIFRRGIGANRGGVVTFPGFISHGTAASPKSSSERSLNEPLKMFDIYSGIRFVLMGHTHDSNSILINREFVEFNGRKSKNCLAARMGSFLNYSGYSQRRLFKPIKPSFLKFYIAPYRDLITTNLDDVLVS